jgi:hypothetical protein
VRGFPPSESGRRVRSAASASRLEDRSIVLVRDVQGSRWHEEARRDGMLGGWPVDGQPPDGL